MISSNILLEKAEQAHALMRELRLPCWLTFCRETCIHFDPGVDLVVGADVVRNSAFLFGDAGQRIAIVASFDAASIQAHGVFHEVIGYDEDIRAPLLSALDRLGPAEIGLNYSADDITADGLTYGHWLVLQKLLSGTPYANRTTSAAPLLTRLRGIKSPTEVGRIRAAIAVTEEIVEHITAEIVPGKSEAEIAQSVHREFADRNLATAWAAAGCPIVNTGPNSSLGHTCPSPNIRVEPGHLIHMDLGVRREGYCSDLQRMWYVRRPGESGPPDFVRHAFSVVVRAIEAGAAKLRPGVPGYEVDAVARAVVVEAGYPEFKHALGHGLGRAVHDGGTLLGPRWPCYGKSSEGIVEAGNVFTLELGVSTPAGFVGLEEDVLVTKDGCEFLSLFPKAPCVV